MRTSIPSCILSQEERSVTRHMRPNRCSSAMASTTTSLPLPMPRGGMGTSIRASNHTPTLILTDACNYVPWDVTWQYKTTLPNSTLLYFPHAGHVIYLDQPELYLASVRAFLLGTPFPLHLWTTAQPPATLEGPA